MSESRVPQLYDYQEEAIGRLREGFRRGKTRQILCLPTGAGKTILASHMIEQALHRDKRVMFICDLVTLVEQTSQVFRKFGIPHGVQMGQRTFGRSENIQVCSAQTLEARKSWPKPDLAVIDEAHIKRKWILDEIMKWRTKTIGLSATPITTGLGDVYEAVINGTTTNELIAKNYLVGMTVYDGVSSNPPDKRGEWRADEVARYGKTIIGDILSNWIEKTRQHFGGPAKTLIASASVPHGRELCEVFRNAGYNFRQVSYLDKDDDQRRRVIEAFRRGDITGLIFCESLSRGFDVPDTRVLIDARGYKKSLAAVLQKYGRIMRTAEGKDKGLLLDHCGNYAGFYADIHDFYQHGCADLEKTPKKMRAAKRHEPPKDIRCSCGVVMTPAMTVCPGCGKERKKRSSKVMVRNAKLRRVTGIGEGAPSAVTPENIQYIWRQSCKYARDKRHQEGNSKQVVMRKARAYFRTMTNKWPNEMGLQAWEPDYDGSAPADAEFREVLGKRLQSWARRQRYAREKARKKALSA